MSTAITYFHIVVSICLIAAIVLQSGKSAGLGTIGGGAEKILGKKKKGLDPLLSKATIILVAVFMISSVILSMLRG